MSWDDSGARTGPHEIGLIADLAAKKDEEAARRLYRKYRMELFRFGVHVLHDQGLAEEMVQETFIKFCGQAGRYDSGRGPVRGWLFTMAKSVAVDIARRPSSRPFLPIEDFQLPPQYDTVDQALTVLTVDQALDKLPSIYGDVMRLVRDGFTHSEIAERLDIPIGTVKSRIGHSSKHLASRAGQPARGRRCFLRPTSRPPIPRPSTSYSATCPRPSEPSSTAISAVAATAKAVVDEYSDIGQIIKQLPAARRAASRPRRPDHRRHGRSARPSSGPSPLPRRTPRTRPLPGSTRFPRASGRARDPGPADSRSSKPSPGADTQLHPRPVDQPAPSRATGPADGHSPAGVAPLPRPSRHCRNRRRRYHRCRHRHPAQPWPGRISPGAKPRWSSRFMPPRRPR